MIPKPGLYESVPFDEYVRWDCASNSRLGDLARSPAYCKHRMSEHDEPSQWQTLGSAVHCALLEPDAFRDRYHRRPKVEKPDGSVWSTNSNAYREAAAKLEERGLTLLTDAQFDMALSIGTAVRSADAGCRIMAERTHTELSAVAAVFDDSGGTRTARLAKVRADLVCAGIGLLVEFKTTSASGDWRSFSKTIHTFGYHRAAALYSDVLGNAGLEIGVHVFVVTETEPPYLTRFYSLDDSAIRLGREQYQRLLSQYARCEESGEWPGPAQHVVPIDLPEWAYKQHEEEMYR